MRSLSQEQLAEKAGISRSLLGAIEAPNLAKAFSLEVFYDIADALDVDPADLITASVFPDRIINKRSKQYFLSFFRIARNIKNLLTFETICL